MDKYPLQVIIPVIKKKKKKKKKACKADGTFPIDNGELRVRLCS